jgi:hypothetical protein
MTIAALKPRFEMRRATLYPERKTILEGAITRSKASGLTKITAPAWIKPRYWTSSVDHASVIHIATGRGWTVYGSVATRGWVYIEPNCSAQLSRPRALSSPADFPSRRLCSTCLINEHRRSRTQGGD